MTLNSSLTYPAQMQLTSLRIAASGTTSTHKLSELGIDDSWDVARNSILIGHGKEAFDQASSALTAMRIHQFAGFKVNREGSLIQLGLGPTQNPVSVIWEEMNQPLEALSDFALGQKSEFPGVLNSILVYGTLPRHTVSGEEAFIVTMDKAGNVYAHLAAFSQPQWRLAKIAPRAASLGQSIITKRYLNGFRLAAQGRL